jgi:F420-dependent oxidoreductase-like protein
VKFGLQIPFFSWPGSPHNDRQVLRDIASAAEDAGFSSIWLMDHLLHPGDDGDDTLEAYTTLGFLAGMTESVTLGTLVTGVTYRYPAILVKQVSTLDVLSGGRAWLAVGAAWMEREHLGFGIPFPPARERFERLEETLQLAQHMWAGRTEPFRGKHLCLEEPICLPAPLGDRPRVLIGGNGERKTLALVAKYADACNLLYLSAPEAAVKLDVLRRHCDDIGRDVGEIELSRLGPLPDEDLVASEVSDLQAAGLEHLVFNTDDVHTLRAIDFLGQKIIPAFS